MEPAAPVRAERRLAAILAADVAGYARLVEADEEGTLGRLKALRADVIDPKVAQHRGRIRTRGSAFRRCCSPRRRRASIGAKTPGPRHSG
jgi:class 3 adenylate cyclase